MFYPQKRAVEPIMHRMGCIFLKRNSSGDTPAPAATIHDRNKCLVQNLCTSLNTVKL